MSDFGYAGEILKVDLSDREFSSIPTTDYSGKFLGGRGLATKLYWDMVPPETNAMEPGNGLIFATGPVTGFSGLAGCRWTICGKSAIHRPESFSYGNLGGKWGTALKYSGFDGLVVQGKSESPVYLFIHDGTAEIRDASALWGRSTFDTFDAIRAELGKGVNVISIGPAAEKRVVFATALTHDGASVSGGLGSVMGSKRLKAVAVTGRRKIISAHPERLRRIVKRVNRMKRSTYKGPSPWEIPGLTAREKCYGCGIGCGRLAYSGEKGRRFKLFCQATGVYAKPVMEFFGGWNEIQLKAVRLCDGYGLDTAVMQPLILWLIDCYREGLVTEEETGLPLSRAGSAEFIELLIRRISRKEDFGEVLAQGTLKAAGSMGEEAAKIAHRYIVSGTNETRGYDPRMISTTALLYATEPRMPIQQLHCVSGNTLMAWTNWAKGVPGAFLSTGDLQEIAIRFWGGASAADFSTYEGKARAAKTVQDRVYVQESLLLCDLHWPAMMTSADNRSHVGDPGLESQVFSAITGLETDEAGLLQTGERIFNLQRALLLRQGWGGRKGDRLLDYLFNEPLKKGEIFFSPDALMPGRDGEVISKVGDVLDLQAFEKMKNEYYELRGWDVATGFPTRSGLEELGLKDVAGDLEARGLLGR